MSQFYFGLCLLWYLYVGGGFRLIEEIGFMVVLIRLVLKRGLVIPSTS